MKVKSLLITFLVSGSLLLFCNLGQAQTWQSLNGPPYLEPSTLSYQTIIQHDTLYAIPGGGSVFKKSIDNSQWIHVGAINLESYKDFALDDEGNYFLIDYEIAFPTEPPFSIQNFSFSKIMAERGQLLKI